MVHGRRPVEALPVMTGGNADDLEKGAAHRLGGAEPALLADGLEPLGGFLEQPSRRLDAGPGHETCRRRTDFTREDARAVAPAPGHAAGPPLAPEVRPPRLP